MPEDRMEPPPSFPGPLYEKCENPTCPFRFAYVDEPAGEVPHYHYIGKP